MFNHITVTPASDCIFPIFRSFVFFTFNFSSLAFPMVLTFPINLLASSCEFAQSAASYAYLRLDRTNRRTNIYTHKSISSLSDCLTDISLWMKSCTLKLNSDKTEFIMFGTKQQRHKLYTNFPVKLLDNDITPSDSVRNLGVIFDRDVSLHT